MRRCLKKEQTGMSRENSTIKLNDEADLTAFTMNEVFYRMVVKINNIQKAKAGVKEGN